MNQRDERQLLRGVLGEDSLQSLRQATLACGLDNLRRRRRSRRVALVSGVVCVTAVLASVLLLPKGLPRQSGTVGQFAGSPSGGVSAAPDTVKFLTDEELFRLFPNRSMVLVGEPGHQQLVFLDQRVDRNRRSAGRPGPVQIR